MMIPLFSLSLFRYATGRSMPPADAMDNLLVPRVVYSNGYTSFSFIRTVSSVDTTQDIDLSRPKFFVYALNGAATFNADGSIARVGRHPTTPIISTERVTLGTPEQCPGKERERGDYFVFIFSLSLRYFPWVKHNKTQ